MSTHHHGVSSPFSAPSDVSAPLRRPRGRPRKHPPKQPSTAAGLLVRGNSTVPSPFSDATVLPRDPVLSCMRSSSPPPLPGRVESVPSGLRPASTTSITPTDPPLPSFSIPSSVSTAPSKVTSAGSSGSCVTTASPIPEKLKCRKCDFHSRQALRAEFYDCVASAIGVPIDTDGRVYQESRKNPLRRLYERQQGGRNSIASTATTTTTTTAENSDVDEDLAPSLPVPAAPAPPAPSPSCGSSDSSPAKHVADPQCLGANLHTSIRRLLYEGFAKQFCAGPPTLLRASSLSLDSGGVSPLQLHLPEDFRLPPTSPVSPNSLSPSLLEECSSSAASLLEPEAVAGYCSELCSNPTEAMSLATLMHDTPHHCPSSLLCGASGSTGHALSSPSFISVSPNSFDAPQALLTTASYHYQPTFENFATCTCSSGKEADEDPAHKQLDMVFSSAEEEEGEASSFPLGVAPAPGNLWSDTTGSSSSRSNSYGILFEAAGACSSSRSRDLSPPPPLTGTAVQVLPAADVKEESPSAPRELPSAAGEQQEQSVQVQNVGGSRAPQSVRKRRDRKVECLPLRPGVVCVYIKHDESWFTQFAEGQVAVNTHANGLAAFNEYIERNQVTPDHSGQDTEECVEEVRNPEGVVTGTLRSRMFKVNFLEHEISNKQGIQNAKTRAKRRAMRYLKNCNQVAIGEEFTPDINW